MTTATRASLPVVAVVGRPNVGKSTFFNRVIGGRVAIVDDQPGVTRDRNFALADWAGRSFYVVDTGGVIEGSDEPLDRSVRDQALAAIEEADLIVFMVDGKLGPHPLDEGLADILRTAGTPVLLVVNKMDSLPNETAHLEFWNMGLGEPYPVSSGSGKGSGDLLDQVVAMLPEGDADVEPDPEEIRVAVIGRPNVGKSSLINRLFDEERVVVSEMPGTTRDSVDSVLRYHGRPLRFVDTAGLRRQAQIRDSVEYYSTLRTERAVQDADVCVLLVDAADGFHHQDVRVAEKAWEGGCGLIVLANKWDLVEKATETADRFTRSVTTRIPFLQWVPFIYGSALTGLRVRKILDLILEVQEARNTRIPTAEVNRVLQRLTQRQPPPHHRGRPVKLKYASQVAVAPPTIAVFANYPKAVPDHYHRYLINGFRAAWPFTGSPLRVRLKSSSDRR